MQRHRADTARSSYPSPPGTAMRGRQHILLRVTARSWVPGRQRHSNKLLHFVQGSGNQEPSRTSTEARHFPFCHLWLSSEAPVRSLPEKLLLLISRGHRSVRGRVTCWKEGGVFDINMGWKEEQGNRLPLHGRGGRRFTPSGPKESRGGPSSRLSCVCEHSLAPELPGGGGPGVSGSPRTKAGMQRPLSWSGPETRQWHIAPKSLPRSRRGSRLTFPVHSGSAATLLRACLTRVQVATAAPVRHVGGFVTGEEEAAYSASHSV